MGISENISAVTAFRNNYESCADYTVYLYGTSIVEIRHSLKTDHPDAMFKIVDDSYEFINGFKLARNKEGRYLYIREDNNYIVPYTFDFASSFNNDGLAMVGKYGRVTWIDKNFNFLRNDGKITNCKFSLNKDNTNFDGFLYIGNFSKSTNPTSLCIFQDKAVYIDNDMKIKRFSPPNPNDYARIKDTFDGSTANDFNEDGYAIADINDDIKLLSTDGYYISADELFDKFLETGSMDSFIKSLKDMAEDGYYNSNKTKKKTRD